MTKSTFISGNIHISFNIHISECSQQSAWNYKTKSDIALPKDVTEIANENVYGKHLRMLFKMDLMVQIDAKLGQLKIKNMSSGLAPKGELQYLYT